MTAIPLAYALAPSTMVMILFRLIHSLGFALFMTTTIAVVPMIVPQRNMARAMNQYAAG